METIFPQVNEMPRDTYLWGKFKGKWYPMIKADTSFTFLKGTEFNVEKNRWDLMYMNIIPDDLEAWDYLVAPDDGLGSKAERRA